MITINEMIAWSMLVSLNKDADKFGIDSDTYRFELNLSKLSQQLPSVFINYDNLLSEIKSALSSAGNVLDLVYADNKDGTVFMKVSTRHEQPLSGVISNALNNTASKFAGQGIEDNKHISEACIFDFTGAKQDSRYQQIDGNQNNLYHCYNVSVNESIIQLDTPGHIHEAVGTDFGNKPAFGRKI